MNDFIALFEESGGLHYCWCSIYRLNNTHHFKKTEKKANICRLVENDVPIGVIAYDDNTPVGWCSIAPRETYARLEHSRTMPRVTGEEIPTWTVLCFYVARPHRGRHITHALLGGAIEYARAEGAKVLEGYPFDSSGISSTHRGHSKIFKAAGFKQNGRRWFMDIKSV